MFTGIITAIGQVQAVTPIGGGRDMGLRIGVTAAFLAQHGGTANGASIACSGCCLTVTAQGEDWFGVEVSGETLALTAIGGWAVGRAVNLERSLRLGDELGGHMVSGHVDGIGRVVSVTQENGSTRLLVGVPAPLHRLVARKGSVAVDGVSLTVNEVTGLAAGGEAFGVNIIPHTAAHTTLGRLAAGDAVQIEIDMLARYVARLAETA